MLQPVYPNGRRKIRYARSNDRVWGGVLHHELYDWPTRPNVNSIFRICSANLSATIQREDSNFAPLSMLKNRIASSCEFYTFLLRGVISLTRSFLFQNHHRRRRGPLPLLHWRHLPSFSASAELRDEARSPPADWGTTSTWSRGTGAWGCPSSPQRDRRLQKTRDPKKASFGGVRVAC